MTINPHPIADQVINTIFAEVTRQRGDARDIADVLQVTVAVSIAAMIEDPQQWRRAIELLTQDIQGFAEQIRLADVLPAGQA